MKVCLIKWVKQNYNVGYSLHILGEHLTAGFPSYPAGHEHIGLCFIGWQFAPIPHTLSNSQGFWHNPIKQASVSIQSRSEWQGSGVLGVPGDSSMLHC